MSYPTLKKIATENGTFAGELLRENCDFIGYMFFDSINQTFEPCLARICDILYTSRKQIEILDEEKLLAHCTLGMRSNII